MKILHVFDHSIPLHSGYTFRSRAILEQQHSLGWDTCHLTSIKHNLNSGVDVEDYEEVDGLLFYRTVSPGNLIKNLPILNQLNVINSLSARLDEVIKIERPDILHAHSPCLNGIATIRAGKRNNLPVVYECRAFWEDAAADHGTNKEWGIRYRLTRALETYVFNNADAVTTICEGLRSDILMRGVPAEKVTVIPNAVDIERFGESGDKDIDLAEKLGLTENPVIGFIGSFYAYEGLSLLLDSLPKIIEKVPGIRLLLVGGGPQDANLKQKAESMGISNSVVFTGRVPHSDVQRYYDLVDIFIYPRHHMRLTDLVTPLKPLEAMAQKKLVVASDVGGHKELIQNGINGKLFSADNADDLAKTVIDLIGRRETWPQILENGRDFVENQRNWKVSVQRYQSVYSELLLKN